MIVDASVALAWTLPDEDDAFALEVLDRVADEGATVPAIWALEVGNALLMAERRKRVTAGQLARSLALLRRLPIRLAPAALDSDLGAVLTLSRTHRLTTYDAAYLELAVRTATPLASLDADLRRVARALGLAFSPAGTP